MRKLQFDFIFVSKRKKKEKKKKERILVGIHVNTNTCTRQNGSRWRFKRWIWRTLVDKWWFSFVTLLVIPILRYHTFLWPKHRGSMNYSTYQLWCYNGYEKMSIWFGVKGLKGGGVRFHDISSRMPWSGYFTTLLQSVNIKN